MSLFTRLEEACARREEKRPREPLPLVLSHRRVYVMPTRHGFFFFMVLGAMLLGALNHNNNLGFLLVFLLGGMAFVSIFHTYRNIAGISLVSARSSPVFAQERAQFVFQITASGHARRGLSLYFRGGEKRGLDLLPDVETRVDVPCRATARGRFTPPTLVVATTYPFGLFRGWATTRPDTACLVYPRPVAGPMEASRTFAEDGGGGEAKGPGVDDFEGLLAYRPGDPLNRISWKAYSRGRGLHVKTFAGETGKTLLFDLDALSGHDLEKKLSRVCHMVLTAEAMRLTYGLKLGPRLVPPDSGAPHRRACLRELALFGEGRD
jgi:uncharacterized protein (DUF58 family)